MSLKSVIRIANAGGYWGDDPYALRRQILGDLKLDYVSIDFLAEITMSILQKQKAKDPQAGYARDFITQLEPLLEECLRRKIKIITNAGGVNPQACAEALFALARAKGLALKIAVVEGDNIVGRISELRSAGVAFKNMETGENFAPFADSVLSANTYFGAMPVVEALKSNPDIVLCGRVTDTGITLAPLIFEFGWSAEDYDKLAHGIVAGHIIECGAQATGGNFTDWQKVGSFIDVGFPIVECSADGSFVVTKHPGSGGLVSAQTVREQLLYEMGHPQSYITPDVIADFTAIALTDLGADRVHISGVKGRPPTDLLKVSIAYADGFKSTGSLIISGPDARAKSEVFAAVFWKRLSMELGKAGLADVSHCNTEHIGDDSTHRGLTPSHLVSEILLRFSVRDANKDKLAVFRKLLPSMILSGPSGVAVTGGAPAVSEVVSYWPALMAQEHAPALVKAYTQKQGALASEQTFESASLPWPVTGGTMDVGLPPLDPHMFKLQKMTNGTQTVRLPLMQIAHARSGDKGDTANIGLIGRSPECYAWMREAISAAQVKSWFASVCNGQVDRYEVPNLWALNFLLGESLGGGGTMSLAIDAQGKTLSQALLRCEVDVPLALLATIESANKPCVGELVVSSKNVPGTVTGTGSGSGGIS